MSAFGTIVIGVPTAGRSETLDRLLGVLAAGYGARSDVRLLVVDNSQARAARRAYERYAGPFEQRASYVHEPKPGYASVRNAMMRNLGDAGAIAMIDDDEVPTPGWLDNLLDVQLRTGADIVAGRVVRMFPPDAPCWYAESGVFDLEVPRFAEAAQMPTCASHNTLVLARVFARVPEGFDARFNRTGGEDTHFFRVARTRGCSIVWTESAVVHEIRAAERFSRSWIFRRAARAGNSRALIDLELAPGIRTRITRSAKMAAAFGVGVLGAAFAGLRRDRVRGLRALHRLGLAYGMARAFLSSESLGGSG
jgi:succinoglycan biosynthesis protein ExoM